MTRKYYENVFRSVALSLASPPADESANSGTLRTIVGRILYQLTAHNGAPWYLPPATSLLAAANHIAATGNPHGLTRANIDAAQTAHSHGVSELPVADDGESNSTELTRSNDTRLSNSRAPTGAAGGVLGGTYPNPGFAADMATQAELDAHDASASAHGNKIHTRLHALLTPADHSDADNAIAPQHLWVVTWDNAAGKWKAMAPSVGTGGYAFVQDEDSASLPQRNKTAFKGALVTAADDAAGLRSVVTVEGERDENFLSGLYVDWVSGTQLSVSPGVTYIPGLSRPLKFSSATSISPTGLTSNTWYYVYAFLSGSTPSFEYSTTAPVISGSTYYIKSGDNTRRFVGAFRNGASAGTNILPFKRFGQYIHWWTNTSVAPYRVVDTAKETVNTIRALSAVVPPYSQLVILRVENSDGSRLFNFGNPDLGNIDVVRPGTAWTGPFPLSSTQSIQWSASGSIIGSTGLFVDVRAYNENRN